MATNLYLSGAVAAALTAASTPDTILDDGAGNYTYTDTAGGSPVSWLAADQIAYVSNGDATWTLTLPDGTPVTIDLNAAFLDLTPAGTANLMAALEPLQLSSQQLQDLVSAITNDAPAMAALLMAIGTDNLAYNGDATWEHTALDGAAVTVDLNAALADLSPAGISNLMGILDFDQIDQAQADDILAKIDFSKLSPAQLQDLVAQIGSDATALNALGSALDASGLASDAELANAVATLNAAIAASDAADGDKTADSFASSGGTVANAGTGDALDLDIVENAVAQALADFVDQNPNDPAAQALVDAFGDDLDGADVHSALLAHYGANASDLSAMRALMDTDTDTRVVVSAVDTNTDGTDDALRFEVFAIDPANGAPTGNALSATDINLISFFNGLGAAGIEYDNSASGLSGNNVQSAIDELASDVAAMDPTPDTLPVSPNGTLNFGGTGDAPTGDIIADATANAIAAFIATNPNDPAANALVDAVGGNLDGDDLHDALAAHYAANPSDLAAMQALLDTDTDTRVVPSFIDSNGDGDNDTLRFEVFAVDPASGNATGPALSSADIDLSSLVGNLEASDISFDNAASGSSATNVQAALDNLYADTQTYFMRTQALTSAQIIGNGGYTEINVWDTPTNGAAYFDGIAYTAPVSGVYQISTGLRVGGNNFIACHLSIQVDATQGFQRLDEAYTGAVMTEVPALCGSTLVYLNAGQRVSVNAFQSNSANAQLTELAASNGTNFFSVARIGS